MLDVMRDRAAAKDRVSKLVAAELPSGRHDPAHPQRGAELFGVPSAVRPGSDDFLERDDVRIDGAQHRGDSIRARPAVEPATAMYVVRRDAERRPHDGTHRVIIARG